ncbi:fungal-specific transcription factor domain-containing protein [Trichophaea hybrida]|nr:fungal-specific transcription factor domain-containing protein [Trichophaea hybrida]
MSPESRHSPLSPNVAFAALPPPSHLDHRLGSSQIQRINREPQITSSQHLRRERDAGRPKPQKPSHTHSHRLAHPLSAPQQQQQQQQQPPTPRATIVPPIATGAPAATSTVDCYTCRRRRVKCDRQLPLCAKCERTKLECLGYKKPLVWNKGVASRGKMMGKTFPAPSDDRSRSTSSPTTTSARRKQQVRSNSIATVTPAATPTPPLTPISINTPVKQEEGAEEEGVEDIVLPGRSNNGSTALVTTLRRFSTTSRNSAGSLPGELALNLQIPSGHGSPYGHLNSEARYYMEYFEHRVARDLVLFDRVSDNPYRHLLPAAGQHLALLNGILAVAARHHSNLMGTPATKHLPYKGLSYSYLSRDLQRLGTRGILTEPTLAVVMLFIFFETLDSGLDTWKIHLRGARRLIRECLAMESLPEGASAMLKIFMNHVTLVDIIGRTLAFGSSPEPVVFDNEIPEFLSVLRDGEAYNFLGCPAELLEIIHAITLLKCRSPSSPIAAEKDDPDTYIGSCQGILLRIDSFAPDFYITTRIDIDESDPPGLLQLVYAYKCAVRIYAVETLLPNVTTFDKLSPYHSELRRHLSALEDGSMFLKGAVWPVFIAGTGARTEEEKEWTLKQLERVWDLLPQWNIRNAGKVLKELWVNCEGTKEEGWKWLERSGRDWLFV